MNHSARRINKLGAVRYLEIGVYRGATFIDVEAEYKVGVDPSFRFDLRRHKGQFHPMTSDRYFAEEAKGDIFDVVFIDGLHSFEQVFRDFINSLAHSHKYTVWVIDDTVPCDGYSTLGTQAEAVAARKAEGFSDIGLRGNQWHGDVFKLVFMLNDFFPSLSYATAEEDNPQTIVWRQPRHVSPVFNDMARISNATYKDILGYSTVFRLMPEDEVIKRIPR